ncbi:hypothetical protein GCM10010336_18250 [Streptomyces goshikiensis]|nr:hypothetical protein GCM10010336_18250 [Streptomyces goshikiensis]
MRNGSRRVFCFTYEEGRNTDIPPGWGRCGNTGNIRLSQAVTQSEGGRRRRIRATDPATPRGGTPGRDQGTGYCQSSSQGGGFSSSRSKGGSSGSGSGSGSA